MSWQCEPSHLQTDGNYNAINARMKPLLYKGDNFNRFQAQKSSKLVCKSISFTYK